MCGTGSTDESVSIVGLRLLLTPPVGVNRHCVKINAGRDVAETVLAGSEFHAAMVH